MPVLGYGVFQVSPEECERCVLDAISAGYRLIDTAQAYYNEEGVGAAVAKCDVPRNELFLTTKVWITNAGEEKAARSIDESLRKLRTDYIDLLLIHQPFADYPGTWRAMEKAVRNGKVRAIGLSNFYPDRFVRVCRHQTSREPVEDKCVQPAVGCGGGNESLRNPYHGLGAACAGRPRPDHSSCDGRSCGKIRQDGAAGRLALLGTTRYYCHSEKHAHRANETESGCIRLLAYSRRHGEHPSAG